MLQANNFTMMVLMLGYTMFVGHFVETLEGTPPSAASTSNNNNSNRSGPRSRPHIVWIVVDDLGIDDTSIRVPGATLPTANGVISPHMQALRDGGILVSDHTVFKFCSPSRSQLLSGRYAYHLGQQVGWSLFESRPTFALCMSRGNLHSYQVCRMSEMIRLFELFRTTH